MYERHPEITDRLRQTGRKLRFLTDTLDLDYNRVVRFINGYGPLTEEDRDLIDMQLEEWDVQS